MKFDKVNNTHIELAIKDFEEKGLPKGFSQSSFFDLSFGGKLYPPKAIMAYANFHVTGKEMVNNFDGGRRTPCFKAFERLGIEIIPKSNLKHINDFIVNYKNLIQGEIDGVEYNELYKWETIQYFQNNWKDNFDKSNIHQNLIDSFNYENNNLWSGSHYLPYKAIKGYAGALPEKVSGMFHELFDESKDIKERFLFFESKSEEILLELHPDKDWDHYQSRRAMVLYLCLKYPSKYFLYKKGMFDDFCKVTKFWPSFSTAKKKDYSVLDDYFKMCNSLRKILEKDQELLVIHKNRLPKEISFEDGNNMLIQDFIHAATTYLNPKNFNSEKTPEVNKIKKEVMKTDLNQILYGPPGTGKTFNTLNYALQIVDPVFYENNKQNRENLRRRYTDLLNEGNITFTTFHQSMGYEDFIEGIKPVSSDNEIKYEVEDGIFKEACIRAKGIRNDIKAKVNIDFSSKSFFKMSLGGKLKKNVHNWCIENNMIALGWGRNNDYSELKGINQFEKFRDVFNTKYPELVQESKYNIQAVYCFLNWMEKGDIVLVSLGNKIIDAVGVIEGDYEFVKNSKHSYHHTRKVRWLGTNLDTSPKLLVEKNISQQTIYHFNPEDIIVDRFEKEFNSIEISKSENKNHVLIIDEINRGNVSSIFGELITLLESDKRKGNKEELEVTLPYSKEQFTVPNNLHIIGTMNTADRSVEALDTALRRRFSFVEVMPEPSLISSHGSLKVTSGNINGIDVVKVLETINDRITILIDRDHSIGHSYFMNIKNIEDLRLVFKDKIVPLLQEYFYGDYGKIGLVLGDGFVIHHKKVNSPFASFNYDGKEELNRDFYELVPIEKSFNIKEAIEKLLNLHQDK